MNDYEKSGWADPFVQVDSLNNLVQALKKLPGVGPKSAQRLAYFLLQHDRTVAQELGRSMLAAVEQVKHSLQCNNFSHDTLCSICANTQRNSNLLCVVESPADLAAIESTHTYAGCYYVLMGKVSPLDGTMPDSFDWPKLFQHLQHGAFEEVILATNFTTEGEATAVFLTERIQRLGFKVTRLARGVPLGGELEYTDLATVARALKDRR